MFDAFGVKKVQVDGYEADDIIATLTVDFSKKTDVIIASNDRDLWQLAGKNVMLMLPDKKGKLEWVGRDEVIARLGFPPDKIADYKGLRGDPSDNIPGVYGIGDKTAVKLLEQFDSIEDIYKNIEKVSPEGLKQKLLENYEQALMSKKLATLIMDVPFGATLKEIEFKGYEKEKVVAELGKYNFKSLIKRACGAEYVEDQSSQEKVDENQLGLF
jgi:DNA polymerase-1